MVVEREPERRQQALAGRARPDRLEPPPQAVAEIPEPPAPDRTSDVRASVRGTVRAREVRASIGRTARGAHLWLAIEQRKRVLLRAGDAHRRRADQRPAAGPAADQRERLGIVADQQRASLGSETPRQRHAAELDGSHGS